MALVAYDNSDSDNITDEEDDLPSGGVEIVDKPTQQDSEKLFTSLPKPKTVNKFIDITEENDEFLLKKEEPTEKPTKKPIRIVAPSLKDLDSDDDEPKEKKPKFISKSSGLFSILPPPKISTVTTKSMIPNSVAKKAKTSTNMVPRSVKPTKPTTKTSGAISQTGKSNITESDDEDDIKVEEFDINAWKAVCGRKPKPEPIIQVIDYSESVAQEIDTAPEPAKPYDGLDNEAFKKLVGSSKVRPENIRFIDINEEQVMNDEDILRAKALTDPEGDQATNKQDGEPISAMSKRKHHITYLAQQAKANEQELKNRWASNRYSRKQTQAKYGF